MKWTDGERDEVAEMLKDCFNLSEGTLGLFLEELEPFQPQIVKQAVIHIWRNQDSARRPAVKTLIDEIKNRGGSAARSLGEENSLIEELSALGKSRNSYAKSPKDGVVWTITEEGLYHRGDGIPTDPITGMKRNEGYSEFIPWMSLGENGDPVRRLEQLRRIRKAVRLIEPLDGSDLREAEEAMRPKTWHEFKDRALSGKVHIPDNQIAAFNRLDKQLYGTLTGAHETAAKQMEQVTQLSKEGKKTWWERKREDIAKQHEKETPKHIGEILDNLNLEKPGEEPPF